MVRNGIRLRLVLPRERWSADLIKRLRDRFAPGALLHYGQGKWYPGESLPRWSLSCMWRVDGLPIWHNVNLIADETKDYGFDLVDAKRFTEGLAHRLGVDGRWLIPAFEDTYYYLWREQRLPVNVQPWDSRLDDPEERDRLRRVFERGLSQPVGVVMPIERQWWQGRASWRSGPWPVRPDKLFCYWGFSHRIATPLDSLPHQSSGIQQTVIPYDPFAPRHPLPPPVAIELQTNPLERPRKIARRPTQPRILIGWKNGSSRRSSNRSILRRWFEQRFVLNREMVGCMSSCHQRLN